MGFKKHKTWSKVRPSGNNVVIKMDLFENSMRIGRLIASNDREYKAVGTILKNKYGINLSSEKRSERTPEGKKEQSAKEEDTPEKEVNWLGKDVEW